MYILVLGKPSKPGSTAPIWGHGGLLEGIKHPCSSSVSDGNLPCDPGHRVLRLTHFPHL
jgi:hypothetical protein